MDQWLVLRQLLRFVKSANTLPMAQETGRGEGAHERGADDKRTGAERESQKALTCWHRFGGAAAAGCRWPPARAVGCVAR